MSEEKTKYNNTKTIEESIETYWSNVGGYISDAMETMDNEIANRFPDVKETINTENTGYNIICPYCGGFCLWYSGFEDLHYLTEEMNCDNCNIEFSLKFDVTVNFSSYKIEDNNE